MRSAPWQVMGIDPRVRETARAAARRSGMSVGQWLNSVIRDQVADAGIAPSDEESSDYCGEGLAAINERLDDLGRQLDRLVGHAPAATHAQDRTQHRTHHQAQGQTRDRAQDQTQDLNTSQRIADAILRLNGRLDQLISEGRTASSALERRVTSVDRALATLTRERLRASSGQVAGDLVTVDEAVAEIAARQRALDGEFAAPPPPVLQRPAFASVHCRAEDAVEGLRKELAEIGRSLAEAMPRRAVEALEGEVRALAGRLDAGRQSGADASALAGLEQGVREVRGALQGLAPAESLVGFDKAIRLLSDKIDRLAADRPDPAGLGQLEASMASLRGVVGQVATSDALAALAREVRGLADKIERGIAAAGGSEILSALDRRIGTIADAIEAVRVQSGRGASSQLDQLVQSLNDKLDRLQSVPGAPPALGDQLVLGGLEDRIAKLMEKLDASADAIGSARAQSAAAVSPQLDALVKSLNEKLDRLQTVPGEQLSRGEHLALGGLEDRIAKLVEKLDASESRLGHLEAIERGMAELLVHLESLRANPPRGDARQAMPAVGAIAPAAPPPADTASKDLAALRRVRSEVERRTEDTLEIVQGTIETVVDRLATIETNIRQDQRQHLPDDHRQHPPDDQRLDLPGDRPSHDAPAPEPARSRPSPPPVPAAARPAAALPASQRIAAQPRQAVAQAAGARPRVDPKLPPDHPLEPGSGPPRARPGGEASPQMANAAERVAASEAALRAGKSGPAGAAAEPDTKANYLQAARRAAQFAAQAAQRGESAVVAADPDAVGNKLSQRLKALFVGISIAVLIVAVLRFAASYFETAELALPDAPAVAERLAPGPVVVTGANSATPREAARQMLIVPPVERASAPLNPALVNPAAIDSAAVDPLPAVPAPLDPAPVSPVAPPAPPAVAPSIVAPPPTDVTGSIAARPVAAAPAAAADQLPASIGGPTLIAAAVAGDPAAAYEVATRYAEGRGVPQSFQQAAVWYERAAEGGLAPALFRLGALYEKGSGVAKNLDEARRLYLAAAQKGNANAMHNVGVLYAEGIDGKPDFKVAAQWFRKSAGYGIGDSQYNLAVLYARGIGVEHNLSEAYRWFALAARSGDTDAAKKRDEIAGRLDEKSLAAARQAVGSWVAEQQPTDAATVAPPSGGWDQAEPAARQKSRTRAHAQQKAGPA